MQLIAIYQTAGAGGEILFQKHAETFRDVVQAALDARVSLVSANLASQDLRGLRAKGRLLTSAAFDYSLLDGADFRSAGMDSVTLTHASATYCKFNDGYIRSANATSGALDYSDFTGATATGIILTSATTTGIRVDSNNADDLGM